MLRFIGCMTLFIAGSAAGAVPVTLQTFARAETDRYIKAAADDGCFGKLCHSRQVDTAAQQTVVRQNLDTLYSTGVFDVSSPLTIAKPDAAARFQSLIIINQDHFIRHVGYGAETITLDRAMVGSRYAYVVFRTFVDPRSPADIADAHALQDRIAIRQSAAGRLELPDWNEADRTAIREGLAGLSRYNDENLPKFGDRDTVDPVAHLVGTAIGWGGNPPRDAVYLSRTAPRNDGETAYALTLGNVPVDGFWSVTVYNAKGFYEAPEALASLNNVTAKPDSNGRVTIRFGGDPKAPNHLRIMPGWSYTVRLYRPRTEIRNGRWTLPPLVPAP